MTQFDDRERAFETKFARDEEMQFRIDYLADRANEGLLTPEERDEYERYLHAIDVITILQTKARSLLRNSPS